MARDINAAVSEVRGRCEALASSLARRTSRGPEGAEFDDLVQEGLINGWLTLEAGRQPRDEYMRTRMLNYIRWLRRHSIPYDEAVGWDALDNVSAEDVSRVLYTTRKEERDGTDPIRFLGEVPGD